MFWRLEFPQCPAFTQRTHWRGYCQKCSSKQLLKGSKWQLLLSKLLFDIPLFEKFFAFIGPSTQQGNIHQDLLQVSTCLKEQFSLFFPNNLVCSKLKIKFSLHFSAKWHQRNTSWNICNATLNWVSLQLYSYYSYKHSKNRWPELMVNISCFSSQCLNTWSSVS